MINPWPPYELPPLKVDILAPGLPEDCEEPAPHPAGPSEFIIPPKENSKSAARAAMGDLTG